MKNCIDVRPIPISDSLTRLGQQLVTLRCRMSKRSRMPWRAPFLFLLLVQFAEARNQRVKRQWAPDQSQSEVWNQQPFHNHQQRHIYSQEQNWNTGYRGSGSYEGQGRSSYGRPPIFEPPVRSSYGRPPMIEQQQPPPRELPVAPPPPPPDPPSVDPPPSGLPPVLPPPPDSGSTVPGSRIDGPLEPFPTTQSPAIGTGIGQIPPSPSVDTGNKEVNPVLFGVDTSQGNVPAPGGTFSTASPGFIGVDPNVPTLPPPPPPPFGTTPFSPASTPNPFDGAPDLPPEDKTTVDIISTIIATASPSVSMTFPPPFETSTPFFIDAVQSSAVPSSSGFTQGSTTATDSQGRTIIPVDFVPTEVPAATAEPNEDPDDFRSFLAPNGTVILRSPPLPKDVAEKLKLLGFSELKKA
ncbi:unnamed protein product [Cylicocyclus nassatus]|uniref:Uncharacterized protein n=1 Tax=Cylicocyclus nassatus TaxID=53992 RepID=A0AA36HFP7_CYLNA|nr:unnamed protein product [Cylicocyclus nassatus]